MNPELMHEFNDFRIIKTDGETPHLNLSIRFILERTTGKDSLGNKIWKNIFYCQESEDTNPCISSLMYEIYKLKNEVERLKEPMLDVKQEGDLDAY